METKTNSDVTGGTDPQIAADWGVTSAELSGRDAANPKRAEIPERARPVWPMRT